MGAVSAPAQNAFLANNVVIAQDATIFRSQINDYITAEVAQLKSDDPAVQKAAKDDLISKVQTQPASQPSPVSSANIPMSSISSSRRWPRKRACG